MDLRTNAAPGQDGASGTVADNIAAKAAAGVKSKASDKFLSYLKVGLGKTPACSRGSMRREVFTLFSSVCLL